MKQIISKKNILLLIYRLRSLLFINSYTYFLVLFSHSILKIDLIEIK